MHSTIFAELSLVIVVTACVSLFMKMIRQPLILGYILAGLVVGPSALNLIRSAETFETFSALGIALLLFIIGLGMNVSELRKLGKVVILTALATFLTVSSAGYLISSLFGYGRTEALIIGLALFFSSTIIIIKILSDKKEQNRLHGQIAIGVILLDDIVATFALLFVAAGRNGGLEAHQLFLLLAKGVALITALVLCSTKLLPRVMRYMAKTQELLFLFAISWGFGVATLFEMTGFSIEVGALFAGVVLASSPYSQEIGARLKPLRDFFIVLFFITLGESLNITNLTAGIVPALVLSAVVIMLKPFAVTSVMGLLGYTKRVSFKTGINLSQISEFSIVLVVLAASAKLVRPEVSAILTIVAIITIAVSTYLMHFDDELFKYFDRINLHLFEKEVVHREHPRRKGYQLILFGYHHGGHEFVKAFKQINKKYLVVDYDPSVIDTLEHQDIPYLYGDATDNELLAEIGMHEVKLVVSTLSDFEVSQQIVQNVVRINPDAVIICHADNKGQAIKLYEMGAEYVMIPHYLGSEKISSFIKKSKLKKSEFKEYREKHIEYLRAHYGLAGAE